MRPWLDSRKVRSWADAHSTEACTLWRQSPRWRAWLASYAQGVRAAQAEAVRRATPAPPWSTSSLVGAEAGAPRPGAGKTALAFGLLGLGAVAVGALWIGTGR